MFFLHVTCHSSLSETFHQGTLRVGVGAVLWWAEEMLDWHYHGVDIPAYGGILHSGLQKTWRMISAEQSVMTGG